MSLLAAAFIFLTYTDPTADRGDMQPSILLSLCGGWADIAEFDDRHLLPQRLEIPDELNGLVELREAIALVPKEVREQELERFSAMRSGKEEWDDEYVAEVLERRAKVFAKLDALVEKPRLQFAMVTWLGSDTGDVFDALSLSSYLCAALRQEGRRKNWAGAIRHARTTTELAKGIVESEGSIIHVLVGIAVEAAALRELDLLVNQPEFAAHLVPKIRSIIARESRYRDAMEFMWRNEYSQIEVLIDDVSNGMRVSVLGESPWSDREAIVITCLQQLMAAFVFQPNTTKRSAAACFEYYLAGSRRERLERAKLQIPEALERILANEPRRVLFRSVNGYGDALLALVISEVGRFNDRLDHVKSYRSSVRILCALRLFEDREGRLPGSLDELVPRDLAELPVDPFSGKSFGYSAEERRLWSVGEDGKDAGGNAEAEDFMDRKSRDEPTINFGWLE